MEVWSRGMTITVRQAKHGRWGETRRNWVVTEPVVSISYDLGKTPFTRLARTYTCTNFTDAMRIADDLAQGRAIDPWRVIALSERRVS